MKKFLEKLPTEGLLIIVVILLALIIVVYFTKIDSVVQSHNNIIITNINQESDNNELFVSSDDFNQEIVVEKPIVTEQKVVTDEKRKVRIFFVKVNDDGEINLKSELKSIYVGTTPLSKSLEYLLKGPDTDDINRGLLTLIPDGAKLLSVSIKDGVAYLNFNEMFRFNSLGVEGYIAQIKQIVYTATEFDSVDSVQFSIDGARQEYLGPEGVYIGRPISRSDLEL